MKNENNKVKTLITRRESKVIEMLSHGLSEKEIGEKLCISPKTVNNHLRNIRKKIGVTKNIEIIAYYVATLRGKLFDLKKLRDYGIGVFILLANVCQLN